MLSPVKFTIILKGRSNAVGDVVREVKKNILQPGSLLLLLAIPFLCMVSGCYLDDTGKEYTVFEMIIRLKDMDVAAIMELNQVAVWKAGLGIWFFLFIPCLLTAGYMITLSAERKSGNIRFVLIREGRLRYCISKLTGLALTGGMLLVAGYGIYGCLTALLFPPLSSYSDELRWSYLEMTGIDNIQIYIIGRLLGVFLYGVGVSVFGAFVSIYFRDRYMLMCIPLLINYIYTQMILKAEIDRLEDFEFGKTINRFRLENLLDVKWNTDWYVTLIYVLSLYLVCFILFYFYISERRDSGDWT